MWTSRSWHYNCNRGHTHYDTLGVQLAHTHTHIHIKDSLGGVVETETGETELLVHGSDVEDGVIAVEGERIIRKCSSSHERNSYTQLGCFSKSKQCTCSLFPLHVC